MDKSISKLKKELDKWFSLFIRLRAADDLGQVKCFTCSKIANYKNGMQCGHFQSRKFLSTRFDLKNCQIQCVGCNMFKQGEQYKFAINLNAKFGEGTAEDLELKTKMIVKISRQEYKDYISYYKHIVKNLKKDKGLM